MSLFQIYARALSYLAVHKMRVSAIVIANIILAAITIAEPILFGRIINAISTQTSVTSDLILWATLALFNTVAFVLVAREADRLAHTRRSTLITEAFGRIISMPLSWHSQRGTSNALHTLLRAWRNAVRPLARIHARTSFDRRGADAAGADRLAMDYRLSLVLVVLGTLYVVIGKVVMAKTKDGQAAVEGHYHTVFGHVSDAISNVSVVHSYNRIEAGTRELKAYTQRLMSAQLPVLDGGLWPAASTASPPPCR